MLPAWTPLEGRLCGRVVRPRDQTFLGAQIFGIYKLGIDPTGAGGDGIVNLDFAYVFM
jgi:hypothetical protein